MHVRRAPWDDLREPSLLLDPGGIGVRADESRFEAP